MVQRGKHAGKMRILIAILLLPLVGLTQNRLVINNNAYVNIDGDAYLVLDNPNTNAITTLGTGSNIVSESETDVIKWNISNTTGNYIIPWTTNSGTKIPQELDISLAGSSGGHLILSTYETATDLNVAYPSGVTNMNFNAVDKSLFVVDRFWHIDARSYGTMPSGRMVLGYDPAANEMGGTNTIIEANLLAERFNTGLGHWEAYNLLGANDAGNDRVTSIPFTAADFYQDWILVDQTNPLPVTLLNFDAKCDDNKVLIEWSTTTEVNNSHFILEKSYDANTFFEIATINGAGNSSTKLSYSFIDDSPNSGSLYYRLKQVDFNGSATYHSVITTSCQNNGFTIINPGITGNTLSFDLINPNMLDFQLSLFDYNGKLIAIENIYNKAGRTEITIPAIAKGIYILHAYNSEKKFSIKIYKNN
jgi:hypothetical protein